MPLPALGFFETVIRCNRRYPRTSDNNLRTDWNQISICETCTYAFEGGSADEVLAETVFPPPPVNRL